MSTRLIAYQADAVQHRDEARALSSTRQGLALRIWQWPVGTVGAIVRTALPRSTDTGQPPNPVPWILRGQRFASLHFGERIAPSNAGTKHLGLEDDFGGRQTALINLRERGSTSG